MLCEVVRRRTSVHVEDGRSSVHVEVLRLYTWKNTWKINLAGNGDFGGQLVSCFMSWIRIGSEPRDKCMK